jgi:putative restriction endonuclease
MALERKHVQQAFSFILKNGFSPNKQSTKWDIVDPETQKRFPPKAILRVAKMLAEDKSPGGRGGWPTNDPLIALGFEIVLKTERLSDEATDIKAVLAFENDETTRERLIDARLGQGGFREALLEIWNGQCAVTGCKIKAVLRASHIKPWRHSSHHERLDPSNGILLAASLDALFDNYLVTFMEDGTMQVDYSIRETALKNLAIPGGKKLVFGPQSKRYLIHHRAEFDIRSSGKPFIW